MSSNKSFSNETSDRYARAIFELAKENNELEKVEKNIQDLLQIYNSNEGFEEFIKNPTQSFFAQQNVINKILIFEKKLKLSDPNTFKNFINTINTSKQKLVNFLNKAKKLGKTVHGYGASTKGNVLLQYYKINNKMIDCVAERNKNKYNLYTPGTNIKIISEVLSRFDNPDYYLVLPWHFKKEILKREKKFLKNGGQLIFPLPKLHIQS